MDQGPAVFVGGLEGRAEGRAGIAEGRGDLVLQVEIPAPERRHVGQDPAESIGLVHEAGGEHALGHMVSLSSKSTALSWPGSDHAVDGPHRICRKAGFALRRHGTIMWASLWRLGHA